MSNITKSYYKSIDGFRFFCFFIVFLFHCHIPGFQLGWSGVTFFFVISGFLITEILINSKDSSNYFKSFYIRRTLRIFPVYYIVLLGAVSLFLIMNKRIPTDLFYCATYTQNIYWIPTKYSSDLISLLAHTWTLCIEEQFYILWPLLVWITPNKKIPTLCIGIILFAIVFRGISISTGNPYITSILLPSQIDTLAIGALLACYKLDLVESKYTRWFIKNSLGISIMGIILIIVVMSDGFNLINGYKKFDAPDGYINNIFTSQIFFFIALFAAHIANVCISRFYERERGGVFQNKLFVHLGKISYGLYLYHWPIITALRHTLIKNNVYLLAICGLILTYLVAVISFYTIEKYFNNLKKAYTYK